MKASDIDWKKVAERVLEAEGKAKGKREPWQDFNLPQTYKASSHRLQFPADLSTAPAAPGPATRATCRP
jgi:hypothetical protein